MKRTIPVLITLILLLSLFGCGSSYEDELISPTAFYYHNPLDSKEDFNDIFVIELHEGHHYQDDYISLLNSYFADPVSENLVNPFPAGLNVISLKTEEDTTYVVLSDQISKLSGVDLTMACSCLSLTLFDLTGCNYVHITAENGLPSNQEFILMSKDSLLFTDDTQLPSETE